jgi:hypothetical protein
VLYLPCRFSSSSDRILDGSRFCIFYKQRISDGDDSVFVFYTTPLAKEFRWMVRGHHAPHGPPPIASLARGRGMGRARGGAVTSPSQAVPPRHRTRPHPHPRARPRAGVRGHFCACRGRRAPRRTEAFGDLISLVPRGCGVRCPQMVGWVGLGLGSCRCCAGPPFHCAFLTS